jgi:hypothetical protein
MTSPSPLERLAGPGNVLAKEPPDAKEFAGLVRSGLARLTDAENETNSLDSRFDLAYGAAHSLCLAALDVSLYKLLQILSVTLFERTPIFTAVSDVSSQFDEIDDGNQLQVFDL